MIRLFCISFNNLLVEEAYYWNYAQHLDFGYLDHPPMVALLIKLTTSLFGTNEFGVRIGSLICWLLTAFFGFKLTNLITRRAGSYAVMLLAILPFFFLHSLVLTPDQPLVVCWSATLYCLYRSLILEESQYWYMAGIWIGLGLLSKYTIVLIGPSVLLYLLMVPSARVWSTRKEPYACVLIALFLFSPVIYWNATHEWASFVFQSTRRLKSSFSFSLHHFFGLLVFFLTPLGVVALWSLLKKNSLETTGIGIKTIRFLQLFTLVPFITFGLFSVTHSIKFNWIGPGLLALIPWFATLIIRKPMFLKGWLITAGILVISYGCMVFVITFGTPELVHQKIFRKYIAWDDLTQQFILVAKQIESITGMPPKFVSLDSYGLSGELSFYQTKSLVHKNIQKTYPILGGKLFGAESLMFQYWSNKDNLAGNTLIIISRSADKFDNPVIRNKAIKKFPVKVLWSHSPVRGINIKPYYYQVVQMKNLKMVFELSSPAISSVSMSGSLKVSQ